MKTRFLPKRQIHRLAIAIVVCLALPEVSVRAQSVGPAGSTTADDQPQWAVRSELRSKLRSADSTFEDPGELLFSDSRISAKRMLDPDGQPEINRYIIDIASDCPIGVHEAPRHDTFGDFIIASL